MDFKWWADVAQSLSVALAGAMAVYSIDAWRREFIGKRQMELAEEVLALFYQARDIIESIRSPFGYSGEGRSRKSEPTEDPEEKEALDRAYVLIERYDRHSETFSRIYTLRYRFMAQFGLDAARPFNELHEVVSELLIAARQMARYTAGRQREFKSQAEFEKHQDRMDQIDRIYYAGTDEDPIRPKVEALIGAMEATCRGVMESRGTLFSVINRKMPWS